MARSLDLGGATHADFAGCGLVLESLCDVVGPPLPQHDLFVEGGIEGVPACVAVNMLPFVPIRSTINQFHGPRLSI